MKSVLRLIRFPNLLIVALTMYLIRYGIIRSNLLFYGIDLKYPSFSFATLVIALVLMAAGGYMINDYFDVKIDKVNRHDKVIVGTVFPARNILIAYFAVNAVAILLAAYACISAGKFSLIVLFPLAIGGLWFYSTTYKNQLLTGTLIVSLFTAMVPILVLIFEIPLLYQSYHTFTEAYNVLIRILMGWCGFYALFAFLTNFIREIIKDAEDFEGDILSERKTIPIVYGTTVTKIIVAVTILIIVTILEYLFFKYLKTSCNSSFDSMSFFYIHLLVIIPLLTVLFITLTAKNKKDYSFASSIMKLVFVSGILFAMVVRYNINQCF